MNAMPNRITDISEYYESLNRQSLTDREADGSDFRQHVMKVKNRFPDMTDDEWSTAFHLYMKRRLDRIRFVAVSIADQRMHGKFDEKHAAEGWSEIAGLRRNIFSKNPNGA
jgi:hypothetical protein